MPELPEVERARRLVHGSCVGKTIKDVYVDTSDTIVFKKPLDAVNLAGRAITDTGRLGKYLYVTLGGGEAHIIFHFGMTGSIQLNNKPIPTFKDFKVVVEEDAAWPPKWAKLNLAFADGTQLAFTDPRRLGEVKFVAAPAHPLQTPPLCELAPDPVHALPDLDMFRGIIGAKKCPIKALLLDQRALICGVGNWIADEVLFHARIHPAQTCDTLTDGEIEEIRDKIAYVVKTAVDVDAESDSFPPEWMFHVRWELRKKKSGASVKTGGGHRVDFITVGGRTSAFAPEMQKLTKTMKKQAVHAEKTPKPPTKKRKAVPEDMSETTNRRSSRRR